MTVKTDTAVKARRMLQALGLQFRIIGELDGQPIDWGELPIAKPEPIRKKPRAPRKKYVHLYKDKLAALKVGDIAQFDPAPFNEPVDKVRSLLGSGMCNLYGGGSFSSYYNEQTGMVEILRLG